MEQNGTPLMEISVPSNIRCVKRFFQESPEAMINSGLEWRRGSESNRRIEDLQSWATKPIIS